MSVVLCSPGSSIATLASMLEWQGYITASRVNEGLLTPCSTQAMPLAPPTSGSPASPNNDLISRKDQLVMKQSVYDRKYYKTEAGTPHHRLDVMGEGSETNATRPLGVEDELLIEAVESHERSDERFPKDLELTQRVPEDIKLPNVADAQFQRPDQEVVGNVGLSMMLRSPRPTVAFTQHAPTRTPIKMLPAHSHPRSRLELEFWHRWKPPDTGQCSIRLAYYAVKDRRLSSAIKHLPSPGAASLLSVSRPPLAYITQVIPPRHLRSPPNWRVCILPTWTGAHCLPNAELIWRARCKPPKNGAENQQASTGIISAEKNTSVEHSPLCQAVLTLPVLPLTCLERIDKTCHLNNKLACRVQKPPDAMRQWPLDEAVNKAGSGAIWGHLPSARPTFAPYARSLILRPAVASLGHSHFHTELASLVGCYICETSVIWHANGKGCC